MNPSRILHQSRSKSNMIQVLVVMETGSVRIQNVATQISHGEQSAIAVIKNGLKGWQVLTNLVSFSVYEQTNFFLCFYCRIGCVPNVYPFFKSVGISVCIVK